VEAANGQIRKIRELAMIKVELCAARSNTRSTLGGVFRTPCFRRFLCIVVVVSLLFAIWLARRRENQSLNPLLRSAFLPVLDCHVCGLSPILNLQLPATYLKDYCRENGIRCEAIRDFSASVVFDFEATKEESLLLFDQQDEGFWIADVFPKNAPEYLMLVGHSFTPTVISIEKSREMLASGGRLFRVGYERPQGLRQLPSRSIVSIEPSWAGRYLDQPSDEVKSDITLLNLQRSWIVVGYPRSSCSCTTIIGETFQPNVAPDATAKFQVKLRGNESAASRQFVYIPIQPLLPEKSNFAPVQLLFPIYFWQRTPLSVVPDKIDFGSVSIADNAAERWLTLSEQGTDTFAIHSVACSSESVHVGKIETRVLPSSESDARSRNIYSIRFTLNPESVGKGSEDSEVVILTTSKLRPRIVVPMRWKVEPAVRAYVSVPVDLLRPYSLRKISYTIISSNSDLISVKLLSSPPDVTVALPSESFRFKTTIDVFPTNSLGVPSTTEIGDIQMEVSGDGWKESLQLASEELRSLFSPPETNSRFESH